MYMFTEKKIIISETFVFDFSLVHYMFNGSVYIIQYTYVHVKSNISRSMTLFR
jgi:hypothetical protein